MKDKNKKASPKKTEPTTWLTSLFSKVKWTKEVWVALGVLIGVVVIAVFVFLSSLPEPIEQVLLEEEQEDVHRHPLTGEVIEQPYETLPQLFGVMVESSADAWPLYGVADAFLVIEAPVEAGIPRLLSFFSQEDEVGQIGPVRSARPYYVDWNDALGAIYTHVGGSPEALDKIKYGDTLDLNQFWFGQYFWRDEVYRYAPHNVFTSLALLVEAMDEEFNLDEPDYELWTFDDIEPADEPVKLVEVDFADGSLYDTRWEYGTTLGRYERYADWTGNQMWAVNDDGIFKTITAENILILAMDIRTIDNIGRKSIETFDSGDALLFQMGHADLVSWEMDEDGWITITKDGEQVLMHPGTTWMQIVSDLSQVTYE